MRKKVKQKNVVITACLVLLFLSCQPILADQTKEEAALTAAANWLALVDAERYVASFWVLHQVATPNHLLRSDPFDAPFDRLRTCSGPLNPHLRSPH